jgi:hypothetical protein
MSKKSSLESGEPTGQIQFEFFVAGENWLTGYIWQTFLGSWFCPWVGHVWQGLL